MSESNYVKMESKSINFCRLKRLMHENRLASVIIIDKGATKSFDDYTETRYEFLDDTEEFHKEVRRRNGDIVSVKDISQLEFIEGIDLLVLDHNLMEHSYSQEILIDEL